MSAPLFLSIWNTDSISKDAQLPVLEPGQAPCVRAVMKWMNCVSQPKASISAWYAERACATLTLLVGAKQNNFLKVSVDAEISSAIRRYALALHVL